MMKLRSLAILCALTAACGGKKSDDKSAATTKPSEPAKPAPPPPPFTGTLTVERVMGAKGIVEPFVPWSEGLARLEAQLGKPTKVDGGKHQWAAMTGDDCAYVEVEKEDGAKYKQTGEIVGSVMSPMTVAKDGPSMNRSQCLKILGKDDGPAEDPNAAAPPTDGSAVGADVFRTTALAGRSKWNGQAVKVSGVVAGVTTSTSGSDSWTNVTLKAGDADSGKPVSCNHPKNTAATVKIGDAVVAAGTVKIDEWTSMGSGGTTYEASLAECVASAAPAAKGKGK